MTTTQTPTAQQIGDTFVALLRQELTPEQFREMRRRNATPEYAGTNCCASHDFCDANMVMLAAFQQHGLEPLAEADDMASLWNAAWTSAAPQLTAAVQS